MKNETYHQNQTKDVPKYTTGNVGVQMNPDALNQKENDVVYPPKVSTQHN